jgi:hypothetical protein
VAWIRLLNVVMVFALLADLNSSTHSAYVVMGSVSS